MDDRISHEIHDAGLQPGRWPAILALISEQFGGASVFLCHAFKFHPQDGDAWTHNYDMSRFRDAPAQLWSEDANPITPLMLRAPLGVAVDRRSIFTDACFERHPVARQLLLPQKLFHFLITAVHRDADTASPFGIARGRRTGEFTPEDTAHFERLAGDTGRAMRMHRALGRIDAQAAGVKAMLDGIAQSVVLTDAGLRILYANAAAERLLDAGDGLRSFRGAIRLHDAAAQRRLEGAVLALAAGLPIHAEEVIRALRPSRAAALRLSVFPAPGDTTTMLAPRARAVVLIHDPEAALDALTPERLESHYGLTSAEGRVAVLAGRAMGAAAIARQLSASPNTVKTHLKAVFGKLGVNTQAELVRLLMARYPPICGQSGFESGRIGCRDG